MSEESASYDHHPYSDHSAECRRNWGVRTYREFQNHLQKFDSDMTAVFELNQNQSHQQTIEEYSLKVHGSSLLGLAPS